MKSNTSTNIRLGIFVIAGMLIFSLAAYLVGSDQSMFQDTFRLRTQFRNVNGLQTGNNVRFSGIHVGTVKRIQMINDSTVEVEMVVDKSIQEFIKTNARAAIGSDGLVGSRVLNIVPGTGDAPVVVSGDYIPGLTKLGTEQMMSTIGTTSENISLLAATLLEITNDINSGRGTLGMLIKDTLTAYHLKETLKNLRATSEKAASSMEEISNVAQSLDNGEGLAYAILRDTALAGRFRNVISDLEASGKNIRSLSDSLDEMASNIGSEGGALNYLTGDEEAAQKLRAILDNVEQGTEKFDENMAAMREHFLFKSYFKKQERKAQKE